MKSSKKEQQKPRKQWLKSHLADPYVKQAYKEGYRSRAVYKLLEIQEKDRIIRPGMRVIDLGSAPGGWSQVVKKVLAGHGRIIGLDILPMDPIEGVDFIQGDFTTEEVYQQLIERLDGQEVDVVLSDMAPNLSGMTVVDQPRSMYLAELALEFANKTLTEEGKLLVKVFQGEGFDDFLSSLRTSFKVVKTRKPDASRNKSREVYLLATGRKDS